jgi:hypothetical protein
VLLLKGFGTGKGSEGHADNTEMALAIASGASSWCWGRIACTLGGTKRMSSTKSVDGLRVNENVVDIGVYTDPEWRVQPALRRPLYAWLAR